MAYQAVDEIMARCEKDGVEFWKAVQLEDCEENGISEEESWKQMTLMWTRMKESVEAYDPEAVSRSGLVGSEGKQMDVYRENEKPLCGNFVSKVIANALKMGCNNACMKRIVAAPTAGACGVMPAILVTYFREYGVEEDRMIEAMYVAAGIGQVIANRASLAGASGGCQAEIGSASGMAAAAICSVRGGSKEQMGHACAMALKNLMGLVCDPVAGLVEVPCVKRNVGGAVNAPAAADMALAGIASHIPVDQVIDAMGEVGMKMDVSLRETSMGGVATSPKGLEIAYRLLAEADVFVTNTRTKSLKKLGLDYDTLKEKFPRLVFAQVLGYGENGPEKDTAGFDVTCYMARGGVFGTTVNRGDAPMIPTNGFGDFQVSLALASGICAALYGREKSGKGDKVTVSLHHAAVYALSTGLISAQYGNQYPKNRTEVVNPFNDVFRTSDGKWVCICCPEYDRDYEKMFTVLDAPEMLTEEAKEKYRRCESINANGLNQEVVAALDRAIAKFTREELMERLKANDMPCEACMEPEDIYKDEQAAANHILAKIPYPSGERFMPTNPIRFGSMGEPEYVIGGSQGAHTVELMKHVGYSNEEIEEAIASGAATGETKLKKL